MKQHVTKSFGRLLPKTDEKKRNVMLEMGKVELLELLGGAKTILPEEINGEVIDLGDGRKAILRDVNERVTILETWI